MCGYRRITLVTFFLCCVVWQAALSEELCVGVQVAENEIWDGVQQDMTQTTNPPSVVRGILLPAGTTVEEVALLSATSPLAVSDNDLGLITTGGECSPYVSLLGVRKFRGHNIADIAVCPFGVHDNSSDAHLYQDFEVCLTLARLGTDDAVLRPRFDDWTRRALERMVCNTSDLSASPKRIQDGFAPLATSSADSVPCVIVTNAEMYSRFEDYALFLTKMGTRTEVMPVEWIANDYTGDSLQQKVRNYIRDRYNNKYTEWVILGGDVDIIPQMSMFFIHEAIPTDQYYACLDYEWNEDGDSRFGEPIYDGDTVDYDPDVFVGRIPCSDSAEADLVLDKILAYQCNESYLGYQTRGILTGTNAAFSHLDSRGGWDYESLDLLYDLKLDLDAAGFETSLHYEDDSVLVMEDLSTGYGVIVNSSMTSSSAHFHTKYGAAPWQHEWIEHWWLRDQMSDANELSVFFNYTCHSTELSYDSCTARSFMLSQPGGGVAYLGSSFYSWSVRIYPDFHEELFDIIFDNGSTRLGRAVAESKLVLTPPYDWTNDYRRTAIFGYTYLGDPHMPIWTDCPGVLYILCPDSLDEGPLSFTVYVRDHAMNFVPEARVCLRFGSNGVYEIGTTDMLGRVTFDVDFGFFGSASVVASKQDYFVAESTIVIVGSPPGCPKMYLWDGDEYQFQNSILAHSEDVEDNSIRNDFYAVADAPVVDDRIRLKISEDENEISTFRAIKAFSVEYDDDVRLAYTSGNRLRALTGDVLVPTEALLNGERNVTGMVSANDSMSLEASGPGYLLLRYVDPNLIIDESGSFAAQSKALGSSGGGGIDPPPGGKGITKVSVDGSTRIRNVVRVSALDQDSNWVVVNKVYPRLRRWRNLTELGDYFVDGVLSVKVEWSVSTSIDCLPYEFFAESDFQITPLTLESAVHSDAGDVGYEMDHLVSEDVYLEPSEDIVLDFSASPPPSGRNLALVLLARGRYVTSRDSDGDDGGNVATLNNYPNPCNLETTFLLNLPRPAEVSLVLYNILGQRVRTIAEGMYDAGAHEITWDGRGENGRVLSSGVYFGRLVAGSESLTRKVMLLK